MNKKKSVWNWVMPTALILFICSVITLPLILVLTYAGNSESPTHTLELKDNRLYWDSDVDVFENGTAGLSLFRSHYQSVDSENGDHVLAPGTAADVLLKFVNKSEETVTYYAYMYELKSDSRLPVTTAMTGRGAAETQSYPVPDELAGKDIVTVLKGTSTRDTVADFTISWNWTFEVDDAHDAMDTYFGDKAAYDSADDITVGFYLLVVTDGGEDITPLPPHTGDDMIPFTVALLAISGIILIIALVGKRRRNDKADSSY